MKLNSLRSILTIALFTFVPACGGGTHSSPGIPGAMATIRGDIVNSAGVPTDPTPAIAGPANVRVGIVWIVEGTNGAPDSRVAQDISVSSVSQTSYELDLFTAPPAAAMDNNLRPGLSAAYGYIIAYNDTNGNGLPDLVGDNAAAFVDQVFGFSSSFIAYVNGDATGYDKLKDEAGNYPPPGYSLMISDCAAGVSASCSTFKWGGANTPVSISLSTDPATNRLLCQHDLGGTSSSVAAHAPGDFPATFPAPSDPNVTCSQDGRSYTYATCTTGSSGKVCNYATTCTGDDYSLAAGASAPSGWPCTVN